MESESCIHNGTQSTKEETSFNMPILREMGDRYQILWLAYQVLKRTRFCIMQTYWGQVAQMKNNITITPRFQLLCKVVSAVCTIPNSKADCERVFSIVQKIQTEYRSSFGHFNYQRLTHHKDQEQWLLLPIYSIQKTTEVSKTSMQQLQ